MTRKSPYISRTQAKKFIEDVGNAIKKPESQPLLFYVHGIGGIGKSTLLKKLQETYTTKVNFAQASFGLTSNIETPLALMEKLYQQLPDEGWGEEDFTQLCKKYKDTLNQLETEPVEGQASVTDEQLKLVKKVLRPLAKFVTAFSSSSNPILAGVGASTLETGTDMMVDAGALLLSEKDRLLKKHKATKGKRELQELLNDPLPKLTKAFVEGLIQKSQRCPVILILDTYEKASSDFDVFLCKYLLADTALQSHPIRIVMAGRYSLRSKQYQRMFQQNWNLIQEKQLDKFTREETKEYLAEIEIVAAREIHKIYKATKGYPYYLDLIRQQKEDNGSINLSHNSSDMVNLLLDSLSVTQRKVVRLAAYCRWFDRPVLNHLLIANGLEKEQPNEQQSDWFIWLSERDFVIEYEHYYLDDVARAVIRKAEHKEDKNNFASVHKLLSEYFKQLANEEVPEEEIEPVKYENSDWCEYITESTYHALFAQRDLGQIQLLTHFFAGAYLKRPEIAIKSLIAVVSESEVKDYELLPSDTRIF